MALLAKQKISAAGLNPGTYDAAAGGGDTVGGGGNVFVHVKVGGTATTVTIQSQTNCDQGFEHDISSGALTNTERIFGPLGSRFQDGNGLVTINYTQVTGVTVRAFEI